MPNGPIAALQSRLFSGGLEDEFDVEHGVPQRKTEALVYTRKSAGARRPQKGYSFIGLLVDRERQDSRQFAR